MMFKKFRLGYFTGPIRRFFTKDVTIRVSTNIAETGALIFVILAATLTYLYGTYLVIPEVLSKYPCMVKLLVRLLATWIYFAVCSNMYLVRKRNSSIRNRMLMQPVVKQMSSNVTQMDTDGQVIATATHMGEHFKPDPFGEGHNWHICGACEVFVPPRCWHCHVCNTCILRRDHHCVFTGCCIGEENMSNFLGLLFYLGCGTSISAVFSFIYSIYFQEMELWWYCFRLIGLIYSFFYDFQMTKILASINTMGQMAAWGVFVFYFYSSMSGQTSAYIHRKISRTMPGEKRKSFKNMSNFLGPNPIIRILWPFHPPFRVDYSNQVVYNDDNNGRKSL